MNRSSDIRGCGLRRRLAKYIDGAKNRLARRLTYNYFLRLLLFSFWFRLAFLGLVAMLVFLALFLPKIWRVSEAGTNPVVKISGLDLAQAWSLKRTARREGIAGRFDRAHYAWFSAVANNPADREAVRGLLSNLLHAPEVEPGTFRTAFGQSYWLLHLTRTNAADRELVAVLFQMNQLHEPLISLLQPFSESLSPREEAAYLKALFWQSKMMDFGTYLGRKRAGWADAELPLFEMAYLAGWGPDGERDEPLDKLRALLDDPAQRVLANRLQLVVSSKREDLPGFNSSFERLRNLGEDTLSDHIAYWRVLGLQGRKEEARQLALASSKLPKSGRELALLLDACAALDLPDKTRQAFRAFGQDFAQSEEVWLRYAEFLAAQEQWDELRALAVQMRGLVRVSQVLLAYSYFLEGRAELELRRQTPAEAAFAQMAQLWEGQPALSLSVSGTLVKLGYPAHASALLAKSEEHLQHSFDYWHALFTVANQLKNPELLLKSAVRQYELKPENISVINNYAAALLVNRKQPELAIRLTIECLAAFPGSVAARINHSFALLLNNRIEEARSMLAGIDMKTLTPEEATSFNLASLQTLDPATDRNAAWQTLERIDKKHLFSTQIDWLEQSRKKLPLPARESP
jgi:hypothetical protein